MTTFQPRTAEVTIYQGDYLDRIRHLERKYEAAVASEKNTTQLLSDVPESYTLAEEHEALVAEAEQSAVTITLKALGRKVWRSLLLEHPPRKDDKNDLAAGVNEETFKEPLVVASIVSPELTDEDLDALSDVDFDRLYMTAFALNRLPAASPKAIVRDSPESTKSDATLN